MKVDEKIGEMFRERNEALFSLNPDKIRRYMNKYGVRCPRNGTVFWAAVYKALCNIDETPPEIRARAVERLSGHGFSDRIR